MSKTKYDFRVRDGFHFGKNRNLKGGDLVNLTEAEATPFLDKLVPAEEYVSGVSADPALKKELTAAKSKVTKAENKAVKAEKELAEALAKIEELEKSDDDA